MDTNASLPTRIHTLEMDLKLDLGKVQPLNIRGISV